MYFLPLSISSQFEYSLEHSFEKNIFDVFLFIMLANSGTKQLLFMQNSRVQILGFRVVMISNLGLYSS